MSEATDGTGAGLLAFLDWAGSRGEIVPATAKAMGVATGKVLAVEADPDAVDVRNLDVDDMFSRFETLHRMDYTSGSLSVYRGRFRRSVRMYLAWLDKQPDWKDAGLLAPARPARDNGRPAGKFRKKSPVSSAPPPAKPRADPDPAAGTPSVQAAAMVPYDLPLRPGLRVRLVLPEMLTQADARRIAAFVDSLAFSQDEALQEGE